MSDEAFVKPAKREQYEASRKAVKDADFRDYLQNLIADAMEATGGN